MYSTVGDLYRFWKYLEKNEIGLFPDEGDEYRNGWAERMFFGEKGYCHYGRMNGYVSSVGIIPSKRIFISILSNDSNAPIYQMTSDLLAIGMNKEYRLPEKREILDLSIPDFEKYAGKYVIAEGDTISVFSNNQSFYIQETGQVSHEIFPFEKDKFFFNLLEFTLIFADQSQGQMQKMILKLNENEIIGIRNN